MFRNASIRAVSASRAAVQASRYYAAEAAAFKKPPIAVTGTGGRYAAALYSAAAKKNTMDTVEKEMGQISSLYTSDAKFRQSVEDPAATNTTKADAMKAALAKGGFSELTTNTLVLMAENNSLKSLPDMASQYAAIMRASRGEIQAVVTSAKPLGSKQQSRINAAILKLSDSKDKVAVEYKVDESTVGGLVVDVGDKSIDLSTQTKLKRMNDLLREAL
eukprot:Clim_evm12s202 gene=Clim_evmTU12s202